MEPKKWAPKVDWDRQLDQEYTVPNRCPMYYYDTKTKKLMVRDTADSGRHDKFFITKAKFKSPDNVDAVPRDQFKSKRLDLGRPWLPVGAALFWQP